VYVGSDYTGLGDRDHVLFIDVDRTSQHCHIENDIPAMLSWDDSARQIGPRAAWDESDTRFGRHLHCGSDFSRRAWPDDEQRLALQMRGIAAKGSADIVARQHSVRAKFKRKPIGKCVERRRPRHGLCQCRRRHADSVTLSHGPSDENPRVQTAFTRMELCGDPLVCATGERKGDVCARSCRACHLKHDIVAKFEPRSRVNLGVIKSMKRHVLTCGARKDGMTFGLQSLNDFKREEAYRAVRTSVPRVTMAITFKSKWPDGAVSNGMLWDTARRDV
jgi:hypothetical protein